MELKRRCAAGGVSEPETAGARQADEQAKATGQNGQGETTKDANKNSGFDTSEKDIVIRQGQSKGHFNNCKLIDMLIKANAKRGVYFSMTKDQHKRLKKRIKTKMPDHSKAFLDMICFNKDRFCIKGDSLVQIRFEGFCKK